MAIQRTLRITYTNDDFWFPQVAPQLKASFDDTTLTFDNEIGKGSFYKVGIEPGLAVRKVEMQFQQPVVFSRKSTSRSGYYVLVANLSEHYIETTTQERQYKLGYDSVNGIYFSSPQLSATYTFMPGIAYHLLFFIITHERMSNFIARQPDTQQTLLQSIVDKEKPVYHMECLDGHLMSLLKEINNHMHDERPTNLLVHSKTLELCHYMLHRVEKRRQGGSPGNIHQDDVKKLNAIKQVLLDNYQEPCPSINEASRKAAMSPTKFKTLFKQMFGHTHYQFYKHIRMYKAKELLEKQKMNVSEVAYMLGYNNISKFTSAFKKMFAVVPSNVINS